MIELYAKNIIKLIKHKTNYSGDIIVVITKDAGLFGCDFAFVKNSYVSDKKENGVDHFLYMECFDSIYELTIPVRKMLGNNMFEGAFITHLDGLNDICLKYFDSDMSIDDFDNITKYICYHVKEINPNLKNVENVFL